MEKYKILVKGIVKYMDKYLLVERWYDDRISNPYQWEFVNGKVEFGEEPDRAVLRLVEEMIGRSSEISKILYTWSFMVGEVCNIGIAYLCLTDREDVILSEDLNDYKWVAKDEFSLYIENKNLLEDIERCELD